VLKNVTIYLDATGNASLNIGDIDNGSSDNCSVGVAFDRDGHQYHGYLHQHHCNQNENDDFVKTFNCSNIGPNKVTIYAVDNSGNYSTASATVTVIDNIAPVAIAKSITVYLGSNGTAAISTANINNGSYDNCSIASMTLSQTSFSCANIGPNNVTLTVKDPSGNTSTATAVVTVKDNTAPYANANNITVYLDATGNVTITPNSVNGGSYDNCGIASMTLDKTSFSCANIGNNTVTLTVKDGSGNTSTDQATVTVKDNIAPVIKVKNVTVNLDATGKATVTAASLDNGSSDNCGVVLAFDHDGDEWTNPNDDDLYKNFTCSNIGNNNVTVYAVDKSGNYAAANVVITVKDNTAPVVKTRNISVTLNSSGKATISPNDINNGSSDNCNFSLSLDKTSFSCVNAGANTVTLTATDASGNVSSATATVTVISTLSVSAGSDRTVYYGYAPQASTTLTANASGGSGCSYAYKWSTNATAQSITVSPTTGTQYTCTVTDANGCTATDNAYVYVTDVRCGTNGVTLCHNGSTICTDVNTATAYLNKYKNDALGACKQGKIKVNGDVTNGDGSLTAFPNPFTSTTTVRYNAENNQNVSIDVYDVRGAKIQTLYQGPVTANTIYTYEIKGDNLPADVYFIRLTANEEVQYIKVVKTR